MADTEGGAETATTSKSTAAPAAVPINIVVSAQQPAEPKPTKAAKQAQAKEETQEPSREERARTEKKGANKTLKSLGLKKSERREVLDQIASGDKDKAKQGLIKQLQATRKEASAAKDVADGAVDALKPLQDKAKRYEDRLKKQANAELATLSAEAQKYVSKRAGDDPEAVLDFIEDLRTSGLMPASTAAASTTATGDKGAAAATDKKSTTLANTTPPPAKPAGTLNHHETWTQLKESGQTTLAANYYHLYGRKIDEQKPK